MKQMDKQIRMWCLHRLCGLCSWHDYGELFTCIEKFFYWIVLDCVGLCWIVFFIKNIETIISYRIPTCLQENKELYVQLYMPHGGLLDFTVVHKVITTEE